MKKPKNFKISNIIFLIKNHLKKTYYTIISFLFGKGTIFWAIAKLDYAAGGSLPIHYTTAERYFVFCDYLELKSRGKKTTFREVELQHFQIWKAKFEKAVGELNIRNEKLNNEK